ncbi:MAG: M48 family metallopeptidase [Bacteroidia bacterium]
MKPLSLFFIFLVFSFSSVSQDFENYKTLLSVGSMPQDFRLLASEKYKRELDDIQKGDASKKDKKRKRNFALESNFAITDMMMSGRVIYGDELGAYVNKIADILLKDDKILREELRFYILKSTVANAFSTNQGIIFITSGLIAQVENEAQLAFIMAHEIVHYTEKHNYEQFKKREAILKGAGRNSTVTIEEKLRSLYKYSKNNETEADEKGMELFLKTQYNPYAAISSFDVLLYSYLPYDMIEWNPSIFETEYYKFPENYTSDKLVEISADENEDDDELTHPNVGKRKTNITNVLDGKEIDTAGKSLYLVSKSEFLKIQKIARFELAALYIKSGNPAKAYYIAYLLDNTYGANRYTDKIKAMSLYSLEHHAAYDDDLDDYGCDEDDYEGEVQQIAKFFSKLKDKELSVLAAKYLWQMSVKYADDAQLKRMRDQVFIDLLVINKVTKRGFTDFKPATTDTVKIGKTKVDKLKSKQKTKADKYYFAAFYELLKDRTFKSYFAEMTKTLTDSEKSEDEEEDGEDDRPKKKEKKEKKKSGLFKKEEQEKSHDEIISMLLFSPDFSARYNGKSYLLDDEATQDDIAEYYKEEASRAGINLTVLDNAGKDNFDTEAFNNFALLNDWLIERVSNDTLTMELYQKEFLGSTFDDYKTKYLGWTGFKYSEDKREFNGYACVGTLILYPMFPLYLIWQFSKDKALENLLLVYDVETGKPVLVDYTAINKRPSNLTLRANIYNQLYNLKNGK